MARLIDLEPGEPGGSGDPGDPGYTPPTSGAGTKIAIVTTNSAYVFTEQQIMEAGGPFAAYTIRVTPVNDNGVGPYQEVAYPPAP